MAASWAHEGADGMGLGGSFEAGAEVEVEAEAEADVKSETESTAKGVSGLA